MTFYDGGWTLADKQTFYPCYSFVEKAGIVHEIASSLRAKLPGNGNTTAISDELTVTVGGEVTGTIDETGETDFITVDLVAGQTYTVYMYGSGDDPLSDTFLMVYDPALELVNYDDDGGIGTFSTITFTAEASGTYTFLAESFANQNDPGLGQYTVAVREVAEDVVPDDESTEVELTTDGPTFGALEVDGDIDVYTLTVEEGMYYSIDLAGGADYESNFLDLPFGELDTILSIYDSEGNLVATGDDINFPGDISSRAGFLAQYSGTYYVVAEAYAGQVGGYSLEVSSVDPATADPLDSIDWGTQLESNVVTVYFAEDGLATGGEVSLGWTDYEIGQAMAALGTYSEFADLTFEITDDPDAATFTLITVESDTYLGRFGPPDTGETAGFGYFAVNGTGWGDTGGLEQGGYGWVTMIHEFGHGLGMAHPHDNGGTSDIMIGVTAPFDSFGIYDLNQGVYTTMSYNTGFATHPDAVNSFPPGASIRWGWEGTPGAFDIALIQQKYGATANETGDNVYVLPIINAGGTGWECIWDTGGNDTIEHNGTVSAYIDLTAATLDYSPTGGGVVSFADGIFGGFTIANGVVIENATGGTAADTLIGNSVANVLTGNVGNDVLIGRDGNDTLVGGRGDDTLDGGDGVDTVSFTDLREGVRVSLLLDRAQNTLGGGRDLLVSIENITGSNYADSLYADNGNNVVRGQAGADTILGRDGDDTLDGGTGDDSLSGGAGIDSLAGGAGNDSLNGGSGDDALAGGAGDDVYYVDSALDAITEAMDAGIDLVRATLDTTLGANLENLLLAGGARNGTGNALANRISATSGSDTLLGLDGNDALRGLNGIDTLDGGAGSDTLFGGALRDTLTGGEGRDLFRFASGDSAATLSQSDRITDFSQAQDDKIHLRDIDADTGADDDQAFSFVGTAAFSGVAGELRYQAMGADTVVQADIDGDAVADMMLRLTGAIALEASDFIL